MSQVALLPSPSSPVGYMLTSSAPPIAATAAAAAAATSNTMDTPAAGSWRDMPSQIHKFYAS